MEVQLTGKEKDWGGGESGNKEKKRAIIDGNDRIWIELKRLKINKRK
jgi:hypothetical protein